MSVMPGKYLLHVFINMLIEKQPRGNVRSPPYQTYKPASQRVSYKEGDANTMSFTQNNVF